MFARNIGRLAFWSATLGVGTMVAQQCIFTVEPGHRGMIFNLYSGLERKVHGEGMHFRVPVLQKPIMMDVRVTPRAITTETGSKDLQTVHLSLRVLYHPDPQFLPEIYSKRGADYAERILPNFTFEVLKQVVAQYDADQLLTLRDKVSQHLREQLTERCHEYHIELDDVSITHLEFSKDFAKAIEDKQVAEQMAERAKFLVQKAEQEKLANVIRAEADAESAHLISTALTKHGRGLLEIRRLETAKDVAENLSRAPNVSYLPATSNYLLTLPTAQTGAPMPPPAFLPPTSSTSGQNQNVPANRR